MFAGLPRPRTCREFVYLGAQLSPNNSRMKLSASLFGTMLFASLVFGAPFPALAAGTPPNILLSEINWAGSPLSTADEWIELVNMDGADADISNYALIGAAGTSGASILIPSGTMLSGGGTYLISNYDLASGKTLLAMEPNLVTTAISLPNSKMTVSLADASGVIIDTAATASPPTTGSTDPYASMERNLATLEWSTATASTNLADATSFGTPGVATIDVAVVVEEETEEGTVTPVIVEGATEPIAAEEETVVEEISPLDSLETPPSLLTNEEDAIETSAAEPAAPVVEKTSLVEAAPEVIAATEPVAEIVTEPVIAEPAIAEAATEPVEEQVTVEVVAAPVIEEAPPAENLTEEANILAPEVAVTEETIVEEPVAVYTINLPERDDSQDAQQAFTVGDLIITEFVSSPEDGTEWIEFYNTTDKAIDLTGWTVTDASGKTTELSGSLEPSMYGTIENPKGKLNNGGDTITLIDPSGTSIDRLAYGTEEVPKAGKGKSVALAGNIWTVSDNPTPGTINFVATTITSEESQTESTTYVESSSSVTIDAASVSADFGTDTVRETDHSDESPIVSDAHEVHAGSIASLSDASSIPAQSSSSKSISRVAKKVVKKSARASVSIVTYTGVVTALPGTFGSQIAFIDGVQVYFNDAAWPKLTLGDVVQVRGIPSTAQGESRVKIANASAITVVRHEDERAQSASIESVSGMKEGALVQIEGTIGVRNGKTLTLEQDGTSIDVIAHDKTDIRWSYYTGGTLRITGVVRHINGKTFVYPRSSADVAVIAQPMIAGSTSSDKTLSVETPSGSMLPILLGLALTALISFFVVRLLRRRFFANLAPQAAASLS